MKKIKPNDLADVAQSLLLPYPNLKPDNAKGYIKTMIVHLSIYSEEELASVVDPRYGVVTRCRFPPVIADIVEFVDDYRKQNAPSYYNPNVGKGVTYMIDGPKVSDEERDEISSGLRQLANDLRVRRMN